MEDILDRPPGETVDIFAKLKQPIYQKAKAYNKYHQKKYDRMKKIC